MKLSAVAAITALALVGAVAAQAQPDTRSGPVYGYQAEEPANPSGVRWPRPRDNPNAQQIAEGLKVALPQMHLACAADRQSLCAAKTTDRAADRCLDYHHLKLSRPCRSAWVKVILAREGRL